MDVRSAWSSYLINVVIHKEVTKIIYTPSSHSAPAVVGKEASNDRHPPPALGRGAR